MTPPSHWEIVTFRELIKCEGGNSFPPSLQGNSSGAIPFFKVSDMNRPDNRIYLKTSANYLSQQECDTLKGKLKPPLAVTFPKVGGALLTNKKRLLQSPSLVDNNVMAAWPLDSRRFDPLFHYFVWQNIDLKDLSNPGPLPSINGTAVYDLTVPLPPLTEQKQIATILWKIQQAIEVETDLVRVSRELKSAVMKKLFTEGLNGESQKDTEIGLVPVSWEIHKLGESCDVENCSISYTDFQALPPETADPNAVKAMGVKVSDMNLTGNEKCFHRANLLRTVPIALATKKLVPSNTIVFPKRGAAIATNKKRLTTTWTVLDPNLIGVRSSNTFDSEFLFYWFENFDLRTITEPGPTPQLNKKNLVPLKIAAPAKFVDQQAIARIFNVVDEAISTHSAKLNCLSELFTTTLSSLMSATIRVTDLNIDATCLESQGAAA
jgi:restriction endonuclease S subunit